MWIAKNDLTGKTYGQVYSNIYDCTSYIYNELKDLEELTFKLYMLENNKNNKIELYLINFIRPYNVEQKRFACGFDF